MKPLKMINTVQKYAWGSVKFIQNLLGEEQNGEHWAELWMGDHLRAPSLVEYNSSRLTLGQLIDKFPDEVLGADYSRFGGKLPFLFKVLSAETPLSLQAHPDKKLAEAGFKQENKIGVPLTAFNRNYKDDNHKPEIICALTPFTAMCGFLDPERIKDNFKKLQSSVFEDKIQPSFKVNRNIQIKSFFRTLLELKADDLERLIDSALEWAGNNTTEEAHLIKKFASLYTNDPGILSPFFLNIYNLNPGEALYQEPGELHAYVKGSGIELMSNSDNVLRGGLTPKYIDIGELLKVLNLKTSDKALILPRESIRGLYEYETPSDEFCLRLIKSNIPDPVIIDNSSSLEILLCTEGKVDIVTGDDTTCLDKGESLLVPASVISYRIQGSGELYSACIPGKNL